MKTVENIPAKVTIHNKGKDEHPNRKPGKDLVSMGNLSEEMQMPKTSPSQIIKEKQIKTMQYYSSLIRLAKNNQGQLECGSINDTFLGQFINIYPKPKEKSLHSQEVMLQK